MKVTTVGGCAPSLLLKTSESGTGSDSASLRATTMSSSSSPAAAIAHSFTKVLNQHKHSSKLRSAAEVEDSVKKLRRLILVDGIPSSVVRPFVAQLPSRLMDVFAFKQDPTLRPRIWKILLRVQNVSSDLFLEYVARGPCEVREKIRNDTFRCVATHCTLATRLMRSVEPSPRIAGSKNASEKICWFDCWMHLSGGITVCSRL